MLLRTVAATPIIKVHPWQLVPLQLPERERERERENIAGVHFVFKSINTQYDLSTLNNCATRLLQKIPSITLPIMHFTTVITMCLFFSNLGEIVPELTAYSCQHTIIHDHAKHSHAAQDNFLLTSVGSFSAAAAGGGSVVSSSSPK